MYYRHFGLTRPPFEFGIRPGRIYEGREQREATAAISWGLLHEPSGYTLLVGVPGTGKTTLINAVLAEHHQLRAAYLSYPKAEPLEIFRNALTQLGSRASQLSKYDCVEAFRNCLKSLRGDERLALIFDEAQALSPLLFEELRLLVNCASLGERRMQIVFVGQPSILKRLEAPMLRQLNERIGARVLLRPMPNSDAHEYIEHRLRACNGAVSKVFARKALDMIVQNSRGIPRKLNLLCHNAMLSAYADGMKQVNASTVSKVISEFQNLLGAASDSPAEIRPPVWRRFLKFGAAAMLFSSIGIEKGLLQEASRTISRHV
ncbi:MAG TPA: AAA family ATPase [Candidatus Binataceae bacterium]|nr:AAA family ATPase [Candidatus Binataceae bacterium]